MIPEWFFPQAAIGGDLKSAEAYWSDENYCAQEKLDGARYILHKDMNGAVRVYSRQISKKTGRPVDKTAQLIHIAHEFMSLVPPGTVIDGEVCAPSGVSSSNHVVHVTGSKPERAAAIQQTEGYLVYHAFDMLAYDGKMLTDTSYLERFFCLNGEVFQTKRKYLKLLPIHFGAEAKRKLYEEIIAKGGEGIILKDMGATYYQGKRHKSWVKVKKQRTFDVVFMGIELAKDESVKKGDSTASVTRIKGKAGAIRYGQYTAKPAIAIQTESTLFAGLQIPQTSERVELGTVSGFDDATRDDITANAEQYVGRVFEVTGQEQFASGSIRHPRFLQWRDDKRAEDCIFRQDEG